MKPRARQTQGSGVHVAEIRRKPPVSEQFTFPLRREIVYRFAVQGQLSREISKNLGINRREDVERVIQEAVAHAPSRPPAVIVPLRRAA